MTVSGERLFTEAEWRAVAELERRAEDRYLPVHFEKQIHGWNYSGGDYWLAGQAATFHHPKLVGPMAPLYFVYEKTSNQRITWSGDTKAEVLAGARARLTNAPADELRRIIEEGRERVAKQQAQQAIGRARLAKKADKPKKIGRRRKAIHEAAEGRCYYCKSEIELAGKWHIDHKMPKALGGTNEDLNLVAACAPCNHRKKDKTDLEFFALMEARA